MRGPCACPRPVEMLANEHLDNLARSSSQQDEDKHKAPSPLHHSPLSLHTPYPIAILHPVPHRCGYSRGSIRIEGRGLFDHYRHGCVYGYAYGFICADIIG